MHDFDVIVIGGGLLGCFTARNLAGYQLKTAILETREDVCTGISRANTAIVYSGYDTKPGTLKSKMCVQAAQDFASLCAELGVRYKACGSIMVCFGPKGESELRKKLVQGEKNGVKGLQLLSREEVLAMEPNLRADVLLGLYAPDSGTVMPWELGMAAAENAVHNGVRMFLSTKVTAIKKNGSGYLIYAGDQCFSARGVVNCAGMHADEILEKVQEPSIRIFPDAGEYLVLDTKAGNYARHVLFYEPEDKEQRLTVVPTVEGNILIASIKHRSEEKDLFKTSQAGLARLTASISELAPALPLEHVIRSFGAIRPNPFYVSFDPQKKRYLPSEKSINSFSIMESADQPPFLSFIGVKTPGLTCANELGNYAAGKMASLLNAKRNPGFSPREKAPVRLQDISFDKRADMIKEKPAYGRMVCRCRNISAGEIADSIHAGAVSVDGVKRRTGATSGRCQGSFCTQQIVEILAQERRVPVHSICKDGAGSELIQSGKERRP